MAQRIRERTSIDLCVAVTSMDFWCNGSRPGSYRYMSRHLSPVMSPVIFTPVAEDSSDLRRGDSVPNREALAMPGATVTPQLLTRLPIHGLAKETRPGLAVFATGAASLTRRRR
jgi:hypothetical protein